MDERSRLVRDASVHVPHNSDEEDSEVDPHPATAQFLPTMEGDKRSSVEEEKGEKDETTNNIFSVVDLNALNPVKPAQLKTLLQFEREIKW